jgi:hypothetical protein
MNPVKKDISWRLNPPINTSTVKYIIRPIITDAKSRIIDSGLISHMHKVIIDAEKILFKIN